ncbi:hypothetical protein CBR_g27758 [Chara braunii]|uniref:Uncharacterized protein n=1 Tax=Chara braunii TaxID=69332 RepID=A0A388L8L5_CHABU|nr:hypothetical protein CBR_g27758 [Chara braunii]|eukprot:GBG78533.1 hypothetical protein CBR_g27758 [Chara braunii]
MEDWGVCCWTCFCPCVTVGRTIEILEDGEKRWFTGCTLFSLTQLICSGAFYTGRYRSKLRRKYQLPPEPCNDFLVHCFCGCCAYCQEHSELKARGWDPTSGYLKSISRFQAHGMPVVSAPGEQYMQ